jgi:hypothetical protein
MKCCEYDPCLLNQKTFFKIVSNYQHPLALVAEATLDWQLTRELLKRAAVELGIIKIRFGNYNKMFCFV